MSDAQVKGFLRNPKLWRIYLNLVRALRQLQGLETIEPLAFEYLLETMEALVDELQLRDPQKRALSRSPDRSQDN